MAENLIIDDVVYSNVESISVTNDSNQPVQYYTYEDVKSAMPDNGAISKTLSAGESYIVPAGFHNGSGAIVAKDLASQTVGTAAATDIASGKTAWVNGVEVVGTGTQLDLSKLSYVSKTATKSVSVTFSGTLIAFAINDYVYKYDKSTFEDYNPFSDTGKYGLSVSDTTISFTNKAMGNSTSYTMWALYFAD